MIAERTAHKTRRDLYRRILCLSQDEAARVIEFIDALACPEMYREHIPNEETVRAIEESYDPANLTGPYAAAEAMIKDMLAAQDARTRVEGAINDQQTQKAESLFTA